MKAFTYDRHGPPQTLRMAEAGKPAPNAGEVLVKALLRAELLECRFRLLLTGWL